jgi:predicted metal-dependent peptidase
MIEELETKLSAARTRLILDRPFLGALVLRMPMKAGDPRWCKTIGTDARAFYYNPGYIAGLTLEQTQFALAHEALHCALSHFARREHRVKARWDKACDLAINPILIREGMTAVPGALYDIGFEGMMAEEIYPYVKEMDEEEPHDQHLYSNEKSSQDKPTDQSSSMEGDRGQAREEDAGSGTGQG